MTNATKNNNSELLIYQNQDGEIKLDVLLDNDTVWLTQAQMADLFVKAKSTINEHIKNIFNDGELLEAEVIKKFGNSEFQQKAPNYYNLDVIISVGYRVKSRQGTQFRIWATQRLKEYSERFFYQKIKDIYTTAIDYDPQESESIKFFKIVQNKLLWAISGQTAAELVHRRSDASLPLPGMQSFAEKSPAPVRKKDVSIAKNYLGEAEIKLLGLIVEQYLAFAETMALQHTPMYMKDWIARLDGIIQLNGWELLDHAGKISHSPAMEKSGLEYEKYRQQQKEVAKEASLQELEQDIAELKKGEG